MEDQKYLKLDEKTNNKKEKKRQKWAGDIKGRTNHKSTFIKGFVSLKLKCIVHFPGHT